MVVVSKDNGGRGGFGAIFVVGAVMLFIFCPRQRCALRFGQPRFLFFLEWLVRLPLSFPAVPLALKEPYVCLAAQVPPCCKLAGAKGGVLGEVLVAVCLLLVP